MAQPPRFKTFKVEEFPGLPPAMRPFFDRLSEFSGSVSDALTQRLTRSENMRAGEQIGAIFTAPSLTIKSSMAVRPRHVWVTHLEPVNGATAATDGFITPTLLNSWALIDSGFEKHGYRINTDGETELRGLVSGGSVGATAAIFTMPAGYRPAKERIFIVPAFDDKFAHVRVRTNGDVVVTSGITGGAGQWIDLGGIRFPAVNPAAASVSSISSPWSCTWTLTSRGEIALSFQGLVGGTKYRASIAYE